MEKILVIGSYNVGISIVSPKIPARGETVLGGGFAVGPGGKGSNQAITLARLGADLHFLCKIGDDSFGKDALALFKREKMSLDSILVEPNCHSGAGLVLIDEQGYNAISVAPGANEKLSLGDLRTHAHLFKACRYLLVQFETPHAVVAEAIRMAKAGGATVICNPAPARQLDDEFLRLVDFLTPNETEAEILTGLPVRSVEEGIAAARQLIDRGTPNVVVTLGGQGAVWAARNFTRHFPAFPVKAVDTTGAGDAFNGGFAYGLATGMPVEEALLFGSRVAALSVTRYGTVAGLPTLAQVQSFDEQILSQSVTN